MSWRAGFGVEAMSLLAPAKDNWRSVPLAPRFLHWNCKTGFVSRGAEWHLSARGV